MPLERPQRVPMYGPDGELTRKWAEYFDAQSRESAANSTGLGSTQTTLTSLQGDVNDLEAWQVVATADLAELHFLRGF